MLCCLWLRFLQTFEVKIRQQVINDRAYLLDETKRIDINPYREIVCRPFLLPIECRDIEGVDRMTVDVDLAPVNYR